MQTVLVVDAHPVAEDVAEDAVERGAGGLGDMHEDEDVAGVPEHGLWRQGAADTAPDRHVRASDRAQKLEQTGWHHDLR